MKNLTEALKINSKSKVNKDEEFYEKSSEIWNEVQNEIEANAAYRTYDFSDGMKKYKKGFIYFAGDGEFISIEAFNNTDDLDDLFNVEPGYYKDMDDLEIGEYSDKDPDGGKILRIW